ncbi:MAG TPA: porphobilinogen synthase [Thermomicrobiales bacterium]|nr:porphobilinogen synthase [Thermomicrobiales bacterium]
MAIVHEIERGTAGGFARFRRTRRTEALRRLVRETALDPGDFIYPLFVTHGEGVRREIGAMPGCYQLSLDRLGPEIDEIVGLGLGGVLLFGLPAEKDALASGAYDEHGIVQEAVRAIKRQAPDLLVVTDVCCCEYTDHGHCGILVDGEVHNDRTLDLLARTAVSHARAGADVVAPSDMMDGRVAAIRAALDAAGHESTPIMAYSAKYASAFYGPFREAADSAPQFGDRRSHQMDPANAREALREIAADVAEGADIVMVKPALAYLDVVARARERFDLPLAAYNVSGEYAMVKAAAAQGWIDERRIVLEILTALKRAGADILITYHAKDAVRWLDERVGSRESGVGSTGFR